MKSKHLQNIFFGLVLTAFMVVPIKSFSQSSYPKIVQNWNLAYEASTHFEVTVKIVQCDSNGKTQLHVELLNEGDSIQTASFKLHIKETVTGDSMVKTVSRKLGVGETVLVSCGSSVNSALKYDLPSKWDATKVEYYVTLNP